ncbi:MAG: V-type ATP synthase subunit E [Spirochaetota bacterium]|jgi:V/A-type H+-transporting ATPase subunit E|nr:V-type ATP synthase subunit E [Spirochaetota bacterium]
MAENTEAGADKGKKLGDEIIKDTERKTARILAKAKAEEDRVIAEARDAALASARAHTKAAEEKARTERAQILAGAALEIKRKKLEHIALCIDRIHTRALARMQDMEWGALEDWLARQVQKGLGLLDHDDTSLILSEKLKPEERKQFCKKIAFTGTVRSLASLAPGEAILQSGDGKIRYEICFREIFQQKRRELFECARRMLFGEDI